jgi:thiamine transporter
MKNLRLSVRQIALMGMLVAISIVFDVVFKFYQQANGGSINLAMVGLVLIALSFGWWQSWLAITIVFGLLTAILDGYIVYYPFDYFLALSGFVVIALMRKTILTSNPIKGLITLTWTFMVAFAWRLLMHVTSGVLYFEVDLAGSLAYNLTYLIPSFLISFALIIMLYFSSLMKIIRNLTIDKMV